MHLGYLLHPRKGPIRELRTTIVAPHDPQGISVGTGFGLAAAGISSSARFFAAPRKLETNEHFGCAEHRK